MAEKVDHLPCPLCRKMLDVRWTYKEKPYVVCAGCGVQLFIRGEEGIQRLEAILERSRHQRGGA